MVLANPFDGSTNPSLPLYYRRGWSFEALPFSESEAEQIKIIYPSTNVRTRKDATESAFLREVARQRVVHIASHAYVDTSLDAFSGIVLASDSAATDDGLLMGYEIADLKLHCDLVGLSACETGQGQLVEGEGVLGLPRLFLSAGAKSVLMTLWPVHDEFAAELMPKFYEQFLRRKLSKADALAMAKSAVLDAENLPRGIYYQHPFYWAPFVLYGDPGVNQGFFSLKFIFIGILVLVLFTAGFLGVPIFQRSNMAKLPHKAWSYLKSLRP
jgi:CHAT domain-containing protein